MVERQEMALGPEEQNDKQKDLCSEPNRTTVVNAQKLKCLGYVERMSETRTTELVLASTFAGRRKRGTPIKL